MDDIPLREYADRRISDLKERFDDLRQADQLAVSAALAAAEKAVETAKLASDEHLRSHNDVVEGWKADRSSFITREAREEDRQIDDARFKRIESFQSRMLGGMAALGAIGLGNLVKLWLS